MELSTGALSFLLPKLAELLKDEYNLQKGVREKIESLSIDLECVHAALRKVAEVPHDQLDELVAIWARDVRKASYEMEDIVDSFLVRVDGVHEDHEATANKPGKLNRLKKKMGNLFNLKKAMDRRSIAGKIDDIRNQLRVVAERRAMYKVDDFVAKPAATTSTLDDPRLLDLYRVTKLFGIDEPRDKLISMLFEGEDGDGVSGKEMKIVSIVGYGGLGKTTLAKAVYDKLKVKFECGAFVPVGQKPDLKKVFGDILIDLDKEKYKDIKTRTWDERLLAKEIFEFLKDKKYLIVIDDIWEKSTWENIKCALGDNYFGNGIITTTRKYEVGTVVGHVYTPKELSHENSKKLFYTRIFGKECPDNCKSAEVYDEIIKASEQILKKCNGVPLAITTAASVLCNKPILEWCNVYNSIGFMHGDNTQVKNTMKILSYSYYDLPPHLRACLLYLCIFPEDAYIEKIPLIWRWIAEGFVHGEEGIGLFELGLQYFNELMTRGMILPGGHDEFTFNNGCRLHDMILHLIRSLSKEENFVSILNNEKHKYVISRRISFQNTEEHTSRQFVMDMAQYVRSVAANGCAVPPLSSFPVLRVLAVRGFVNTQDHLEGLGSLLHLRYLNLTSTSVRELPNDIGHLKFLLVLDIEHTHIEELPEGVAKLRQLMCLRACSGTKMPYWIGKLTSLQELCIWPAPDKYSCFVEALGKLTELRVLQTWTVGISEGLGSALLKCLGNLKKIVVMEFELRGEDRCAIWMCEAGFALSQHLRRLNLSGFTFSQLPTWINPFLLPNLSDLQLSLDNVRQLDMEVLGAFTELHFLHLYRMGMVLGNLLTSCAAGAFQNLIYYHSHEVLKILPGSMPRLQTLSYPHFVRAFKDANRDLDFGLENLPSLQKFKVSMETISASTAEVEEVESALRHAADIHPNHPTLEIYKSGESLMMGNEEVKEKDKIFHQLQVQYYLSAQIYYDFREIRKVQGTLPVNHSSHDLEAKLLLQQLDQDVRTPDTMKYLREEWSRIIQQDPYRSGIDGMAEFAATCQPFLEKFTLYNQQSAALLEKIKALLDTHPNDQKVAGEASQQ